MKKLARSYVYWPNIDGDCENMVRTCTNCQEAAKNPIKVPLKAWPSPTRVWQRVHVDFAGPLEGVYYLVVVDAFTTMSDSQLELLESSFESLVGADDDVEDMIADTPLVVPLENSSDGEDDDGEESGGSDSD
ncbi:hypothetical protein Y032_0066g3693 [Ancylostoma ceylanicum]|nr:hypothetical protein Y032_0066g3693 [Ancylostoma ceylanicum]